MDDKYLSTLEILGREISELGSAHWQTLVEALGGEAWWHTGQEHAAAERAEVERLIKRLVAAPDDRLTLDDAVGALVLAAVHYGTLLGYNLGQSWPRTIQDLDGWLALGIRYTEENGVPEDARTT